MTWVDLQANPNLTARRRDNFAPDNYDGEVQIDADNEDEEGAHVRRGTGGSVRVSQAQFYNYHLQRRAGFSPMQWVGRLL